MPRRKSEAKPRWLPIATVMTALPERSSKRLPETRTTGPFRNDRWFWSVLIIKMTKKYESCRSWIVPPRFRIRILFFSLFMLFVCFLLSLLKRVLSMLCVLSIPYAFLSNFSCWMKLKQPCYSHKRHSLFILLRVFLFIPAYKENDIVKAARRSKKEFPLMYWCLQM